MVPLDHTLVFGPFQIDLTERCLRKGGERLRVTPKGLALLEYLARRAGGLVTKQELLEAIWPDTHVSEGVLKARVAELRRVLGDTAHAPRFIQAARGRGYRFVASVGVGDLPVALTSLIGRVCELAEVKRLLARERLVTLWGSAGVGKSRLALKTARDLLPVMPVFWVDLSPLLDQGLVAQSVAAVMGVRDRPGLPLLDGLAKAIHDRCVLLIFDNCEHLVDACGSIADTLLRSCPTLKILTSSREPLGILGETLYPVAPLSVPDSSAHPADIIGFEAVRLFVERATAADPSFAISDCNASAIAYICRCLDGLPLAIELVAARVRALAPQQIAAHLDEMFDLLEQRHCTAPAHHHTLKAAFDWSYELLSEKERLLLECLSVFRGSFTFAAVDSVCGSIEGLYPDKMLGLVARLVDRSLITTVSAPLAEEKRYRLLETIRQCASHRLRPDLRTTLARRHAEFFLCVAEEIDASVDSPEWAACFARLNHEYDNLRAALQWGRSDDNRSGIGLRIAATIWWYWWRYGRWHEGLGWLEAMLERSAGEPVEVRAQALCGAGTLLWRLHSDKTRARRLLEESVTLWRTTENVKGLGRALYRLGMVITSFGELEAARRLNEESVELLSRAGAGWDLGVALCHLGTVARLQQRFSDAEALYQKGAAALRALNDHWTLKLPLGELAILAATERQYDRAEAYWRESLSLVLPSELMPIISREIQGLAELALARRNHAHAARLFGAAEALRGTANLPAWETGRGEYGGLVNKLRTALGEAAFCTLWSEGRKLSHDPAGLMDLVRGVKR